MQDRRLRHATFSVVSAIFLVPWISACAEEVIPKHGFDEVNCKDVDLRGGFWGPRLEIHRKTTIPHVLDKLEERHHLSNFDIAAKALKDKSLIGTSAGGHAADAALQGNVEGAAGSGPGSGKDDHSAAGGIVGHSAFDSDVHKALEGACYSLAHTDDPSLRKRVDEMLDRILAAQAVDGYLVSYFIGKEPENRWKDLRTNHEMYCAGHFFEFAVEHFRETGSTKAIDAAKRFADCIDRVFGPGKRYDVDGHQEVELALVKLYRATGEKRYLDLCRFLLDERGHAHGTERKPFLPGPFIEPKRVPGLTDEQYRKVVWRAKLYWRNGRMQDHKPVLQQTEAVGHAVRAGYMYAAMADVARFSDAPDFARAVRVLWDDVVQHKMYLTGGIGTAQHGDEGFGDPYLLPNKTYCESCACIANVLWQQRMNLLEGDAKYADVMEIALYNSAIAGMSLSGKEFFYQNPLEARNGAERADWIGLACCPTSHARFTPQVGAFVYAKENTRLLVNLFAAGEASINMGKSKVTLVQETNYPWDGKVSLRVDAEQPIDFDLSLRIPSWALGKPVPSDLYRFDSLPTLPISIVVNGEKNEAACGADGYVSLKRVWKKGDIVKLDLPMPVRRVYPHQNIEENKGRVALMRGPMVYCFEGVDQPGLDLFSVTLSRDAEIKFVHRPDMLNGVTVVETTGRDSTGKPVHLTGIPYFAWANRGRSPMNLWMKEDAPVK